MRKLWTLPTVRHVAVGQRVSRLSRTHRLGIDRPLASLRTVDILVAEAVAAVSHSSTGCSRSR